MAYESVYADGKEEGLSVIWNEKSVVCSETRRKRRGDGMM